MQRSASSMTCGSERHRLRLVDLLVRHPRIVEPVPHVVDLQPALARLVAHRTVERMVDQVELHDGAARLDDPLGLGVDHHAVGHRHVAGDRAAAGPSRCRPCRGGTGPRSRAPGGSSSAAPRCPPACAASMTFVPAGTSTSLPSIVTLGTGSAPDQRLELVPELLDVADVRADRAVVERADRRARRRAWRCRGSCRDLPCGPCPRRCGETSCRSSPSTRGRACTVRTTRARRSARGP